MTNEQTQKKESKYAGVSGARAQRGGNYVRPGHFLARIDAVRADKTFKKDEFIAIELTVVHVFPGSDSGIDYNRKVPIPSLTVGEQVSDILKMTNVAFEGRAKAFAMAAGDLGADAFTQEEYPGQIIEQMLVPEQPLAGTVIEVRAQQVVKKDARAKAETALTNNDVYTRTDYLRNVPIAELAGIADAKIIAKFFPDAVKEGKKS